MSPDTSDEIEFTLNENVQMLLASLRTNGFAWMADEIEEAVVEDWLTVRESTVIEPSFSDWKEDRSKPEIRARGQETVALLVVRNYFVELFDVWQAAEAQLREAVGEKRLEVELAPPGVGQPVVVFQPGYEKSTSELRRILDHLLPESGTDEQL
jgi:hypothetical protein